MQVHSIELKKNLKQKERRTCVRKTQYVSDFVLWRREYAAACLSKLSLYIIHNIIFILISHLLKQLFNNNVQRLYGLNNVNKRIYI